MTKSEKDAKAEVSVSTTLSYVASKHATGSNSATKAQQQQNDNNTSAGGKSVWNTSSPAPGGSAGGGLRDIQVSHFVIEIGLHVTNDHVCACVTEGTVG
jgi:hypothetical protein